MMDKKLFHALQVRFVKLRFTIAFFGDSILPKDKVSAIRGGMGEMLLQMNCVRDRQCESCDFEKDCIVQKIMYSQFEIEPYFITSGGSIGYVLECENYQENFKCDEKLDFYLILFGKTIVQFNQIYQAICTMGQQEGIGKYHAKFQIVSIKNMEGMPVLEADRINTTNYIVHNLCDYIMFRKMRLNALLGKSKVMMVFDTPLALKYRNEYLQEFQMEAILSAIRRRVYMLNCFEGIDCDIIEQGENSSETKIIEQEHHLVGVSRFSTRKNRKMILRGLKGYALLDDLSENEFALLLIGELIHIGKCSSFGFGRYHLRLIDDSRY